MTASESSIITRDIAPRDLVIILRAAIGLPSNTPVSGELAVSVRRSLPNVVNRLDGGAWIAWCLTGLLVCGDGFPTMHRTRIEAKRIAAALAMLRSDGNLSAAARALGVSRKILRDNLRAFGLYPWSLGPRTEAGDQTVDIDND